MELGLVPVFYHADVEVARTGGRGLCRRWRTGGRVHQPGRLRATGLQGSLRSTSPGPHPDVILGVGSVVDAPTAALYIANGANFVVGPVLNPEVARLCNRRKIAYSPGCGSASEISEAEELGVEIVKVFPGRLGRRARLRQVGPGPLPLDAHHAHRRRGCH